MGTIIINGKNVNHTLKNDTPLLWYLREHLQLSGTKFGCGKGLCGACTIHVEGIAMRSCQLTLNDVEGKQITTIEGIPTDHPIIIAWQEIQVPQCGYCQSGQIMSAIALTRQNSSPTETVIIEAMEGNVCRCGTYMRIKKAIKHASSQMGALS